MHEALKQKGVETPLAEKVRAYRAVVSFIRGDITDAFYSGLGEGDSEILGELAEDLAGLRAEITAVTAKHEAVPALEQD